MIKKRIALSFVLCLTTLTACTGSNEAEKQLVSAATVNQSENQSANLGEESNSNLGEERIVYGEVYEIIGNFLTLKLIETPVMNREGGGRMADMEGLSEEERQERMNEFRSGFEEGTFDPEAMGERVANFDPEAMGERIANFDPETMGERIANFDPETRGERIANFDPETMGEGTFVMPGGAAQREVQYTGEQIDVIIPVGTAVVTTSWGESGTVESEIKLETVKAGDTLMIEYGENGETVIKVTLTTNAMGMARGGGGGMQQRSLDPVIAP